MVPRGPPPLNWRVTELSSPLSWLPIMEAPISARPRAAVATGVVPWICRACSTISRPVMAEAITAPSEVMTLTISSAIVLSS